MRLQAGQHAVLNHGGTPLCFNGCSNPNKWVAWSRVSRRFYRVPETSVQESPVAERPLSIDLNAPVHLADLPGFARKAFWWWAGEMSALLPGVTRRMMPKAPEVATLQIVDDKWQITGGDGQTAPLVIDHTQDDRGVADQILRSAPNFSLSQLVILLPAAQVLRRRLDLPLLPGRQLLSALELQVDRLTPFKPETVRLAVKVVARDAVEGKVTADCAITPRGPVDALEERLSRLGFKATKIDVADADGHPSGFDLRVPDEQAASQRPWLIKLGLAAGVIACWYFAGTMWDVARQQELDSWQARIDGLRPQAVRSAAMRQRLEGLTEPFEIARRHHPAAVLSPIKELTNIVPDTARLTEFAYTADGIDIAGLASDASALIPMIEASPMFRDVKFRSQVMRRPESNKDRFEISLKLEKGKP